MNLLNLGLQVGAEFMKTALQLQLQFVSDHLKWIISEFCFWINTILLKVVFAAF